MRRRATLRPISGRRRHRLPAATPLLLVLAWQGIGSGAARGQGGATAAVFADGFGSGTLAGWSIASPLTAPPAVCPPPIAAVDTSGATVVGSGSPASCTEAALDAALLANNGLIRFACGTAPHTITVSAEKVVTGTLVIDGGGTVTLSGGGATRILSLRPPFGVSPPAVLTVERLTLVAGYTGNLPGGSITSGGAAIYRDSGGHLRVIDSVFSGNVGPATGQDVAGGAVYSFGTGTTTIVGSTFVGNRCSSGGALGNLGNDLTVVNSLLVANAATGTGGNPGSGGNGGGIYMDGNSQTVTLCGIRVLDNRANARGGGVFRVSNDGVGPMGIDRSTVAGNRIPDGPDSQAGGLYLQGLQLTITGSTIARNVASSVGGMFVATNPGTQTLSMTNDTVAENRASTGLGAGMAVAAAIAGTLRHLTIARNANSGDASFASALSGGDGLTVSNCVVADNAKVFIWENTSCNATHPGGGTYQWPDHNAGGQSELPCTSVTFANPALGRLEIQDGATATIPPALPALRHAAGSGCAATDQRGFARGQPCTPGAVEMP